MKPTPLKYHKYYLKLSRKDVVFLKHCYKVGAVSLVYHSLSKKINSIELKKEKH